MYIKRFQLKQQQQIDQKAYRFGRSWSLQTFGWFDLVVFSSVYCGGSLLCSQLAYASPFIVPSICIHVISFILLLTQVVTAVFIFHLFLKVPTLQVWIRTTIWSDLKVCYFNFNYKPLFRPNVNLLVLFIIWYFFF